MLAVAANSVVACSTLPAPVPGLLPRSPQITGSQPGFSDTPASDYKIRAADAVSITVFREPDFSVESIEVGADGVISLPLLGPIKVEGLNPREVETLLTQKLAQSILKNPAVSVNLVGYGSHQVTVEGSVEKAGVYSFRPGTRLSGAISLAGGPSRVAKLKQIAVFRQTPSGIAVAKFDYAQVSAGTMVDPVLEPGDRVVVGLSGLSQFWQDLIKALPAFALFTRL